MFKCLKVMAYYMTKSSITQGRSYKVIRKYFKRMIIRCVQIKFSWVNFKTYIGCLGVAESLRWSPETATGLSIGYTPIQTKSLVKILKNRNNHSKKPPKHLIGFIQPFPNQAAFHPADRKVLWRAIQSGRLISGRREQAEKEVQAAKQVGCGQVTLR